MFEQVLNDVSPKYEDKINMYKVNIEEEPEMANLFGVMSIPAISMIRKNGHVEKSIGSMNNEQLEYWLEGLISEDN